MHIAVTVGEPAGIGPELVALAAQQSLPAAIVAIGDAELIGARARLIGQSLSLCPFDANQTTQKPGVLPVIDIPVPVRDCLGAPDAANAGALLAMLDTAIDGCRDGTFAAMATGPLQKSTLIEGGFTFSGHTEYLAEQTGADVPVMLLANNQLRVALATTHLPLRAVADAITTAKVSAVLDVLWHDLVRLFGIPSPHIAVCGLNPHAGENGHLGHEDATEIAPAIAAQQSCGRHVTGPFPADSIFGHQGRDADAILAMYHDQGLPVIKDRGFGSLVNITLGLPIIRTSVDHGSALDIAGQGVASAASLISAITLAAQLAASHP
ncbi:MAG: 4-hydroxythreonine-4-phosphate dehydrogenase PdxA [Pseudomonadota bacterium]